MKSISKYAIMALLLFLSLFADQQTKQWAFQNIKNKPILIAIPNFLEFGYTENKGMVFGINNRNNNQTSKNILLGIRIVLSIGLFIYIGCNYKKSFLFHIPFLLITAGAIGNVIDSLRLGYVIDFIHMHAGKVIDWPFLYNLADAYVCIGMAILLVQSFFDKKITKKQYYYSGN